MRPINNLTSALLPDQQIAFRVKVWDTPFSFCENGLASNGLQLRVREPKDVATWKDFVTAWKSGNNQTIEAAFTETTYSTPTVTDGRAPLIQQYWGSGAPNWWGASKAGRIAVCYSGALVSPTQRAWLSTLPSPLNLTFAVAGSGRVKIVKVAQAGGTTLLLDAQLTEANYLASSTGFTFSTTATWAEGDTVRVYYLQEGTENFGGLVVKVIPGTLATATADRVQQAADAPVLSCGLFSHTAHFAGTELDFVASVDIQHDMGAASKATVELPLINSNSARHDGHGWQYVTASEDDPGSLQLMDAGQVKTTLKRKRLVQVLFGSPDATGAVEVWNPTTQKYDLANPVPVFTGFIDDFADVPSGNAKLNCVSFEGRLVEQYEQAPDRISYMARGYRMVDVMRAETSQRGQPVYNIPAFDAWPLAYAIEELAVRAGIDPSRFRRALKVKKNDNTPVSPDSSTRSWLATQFRAYTTNGTRLLMPRPVHYGNAGIAFTERRPFDDPYLFKVEPTKDLWSRIRELTDRLGYRMRFDENGDALLYPSNNPSHVVDLAVGDKAAGAGTVTQLLKPAAYGATYLQANGVVTISKTVEAARIDVSFPRITGAGAWTITVKQGATVVRTTTVDPNANGAASEFLFTSQLVGPSANSTVVTVWPDPATKISPGLGTYTVELTPSGALTTRYVDCLLCYVADPDRTGLSEALNTGVNALSVVAQPQQDEMRNKVTIVGRRKAQVTDSDKFAEAQQPTEQEFVVQNAVDHDSITDPTAKNYIGYQKQSVIYDNSITDDGFARYLAQTFIYRQSVPKPGGTIETMMLPMVQPGDAVLATESKFATLSESIIYVKNVSHRIGKGRATTTMSAQAWPDYPAFEPRYDIDLSQFGNVPVTNLDLSYTTLSGHSVTNLNANAAAPAQDSSYDGPIRGNTVEYNGLAVGGSAGNFYLTLPANAPWPPVPGTVQIQQTAQTGPWASKEATYTIYTYNNLADTNALVRFTEIVPAKDNDEIKGFTLQPTWVLQGVTVGYYSVQTANKVWRGPWVLNTNPNTTNPYYYKVNDGRVVIYAAKDYEKKLSGYINDIASFLVKIQYREADGEIVKGWFANNPYHKYTDVDYTATVSAGNPPKILLPWQHGDGGSRFARATQGINYDVKYRALYVPGGGDPYAGKETQYSGPAGVAFSPFYDPYTSELGYLCRVGVDVLAEGNYRIAVRSAFDGTVVAWLTGSTGDAEDPEKHWEYIQVGSREFYWDGVDQVGMWNLKQSELYARLVDGAFGEDGEERERVGKGFYVWNQEVSGGRYPQQAFIWLQTYSTTNKKPIIGHGTYGQWYISVEAVTDRLDGTVAVDTHNRNSQTTSKYIYTHLPEPTKVQLEVKDWSSASRYDVNATSGTTSGLVEANWTAPSYTTIPTATTLTATVNNAKPIRLRFKVQDRPGYLWQNNTNEVSVKLTRYAHLRVMIGDQTIIDNGRSFPGTEHRDRTIANRRLINDTHTNSYPDSGYRKAKTFRWTGNEGEGSTEWVFVPSDFKREFTYSGVDEPVQFGNYLQLEEVPGWTNTRDLASTRSSLNFALMSYLFYLSAMVTDRSGRSTWALNTSFVDKSKILTNTTPVDWGDDSMYCVRRSVVCRQWVGELDATDSGTALASRRTWVAGQLLNYGGTPGSNPYNVLQALLQHWWWQHDPKSTTIGTGQTLWTALTLDTDPYSTWHASRTSGQTGRIPSQYSQNRALGSISGSTITSRVGTWNWTQTPRWAPSITRDLHPYYLLPPMILPYLDYAAIRAETSDILGKLSVETDMRKYNTYMITSEAKVEITIDKLKKDDRVDAAAAETWSSPVLDLSETNGQLLRFWPGSSVDKDKEPFKSSGVTSAAANYIRQDEMVHWEDLRGLYSRSKLPASGVVKVTPVAPYYLNTMRFYGVSSRNAFRNPGYPAFHADYYGQSGVNGLGTLVEPFRTSFRHEYVWESASWFPANDRGGENLYGMFWWKTRYLSLAQVGELYYDHGAWVGWKDDVSLGTPTVLGGLMTQSGDALGTPYTPFAARWMPVACSTTLPTTVELVAHMVLVPERKGN